MKLSIIVPVYNLESLISNTLDSLLSLELPFEYEIIVINDGSTDDSESIILKYKNLSDRIYYFSIQNSGVSTARNIGLEKAVGEYITFVDGDDTVCGDYYERAICELDTGQYDFVQCNFLIREDGNNRYEQFVSDDCVIEDREEMLTKLLCAPKLIHNAVWDKVYRATAIEGIKFDTSLRIAEDLKFVFDVVNKSSKIKLLKLVGYNYFQRNNSAMHTVDINHACNKLMVLDYIRNEDIPPKVMPYINQQKICALLDIYDYKATLNEDCNDCYSAIKELLCLDILEILPWKMRIKLIILIGSKHIYNQLFAFRGMQKERHEKKIIGIVTIDDYTNYGNRLQNYALTKLIEKENFKVINGIRVFTKTDWIDGTRNPVKRTIKKIIPFFLIKRSHNYWHIERSGLLKQREKRFMDFVQSYTQILAPIVVSSNRTANTILNKYHIDYYVVGSDQVWNPYFEAKPYEFLTFAPPEKRLSFSASIGVETIPEESKWAFTKGLNGMKTISVREERAAEIVSELTNRTAEITIDPTLLLDVHEWEEAAKCPQITIVKDYICTYFLGEIPDAVNKFVKEKGLPVYSLNSTDDERLYTIDPAEFLYMIQNATFVLTDSFHAVAISVKFHKEFYVFERKQNGINSMFSRIESITNKLELSNRIQSRSQIIEQKQINHWDEIDCLLDKKKKESMLSLLKSM